MTNYYELLEIAPTASEEEVRAAVRKMRRTWNARTTNPNADIRAEAEQRVRDIAEAEKILLDAQARAEYDGQLARPDPGEAPPADGGQEDPDAWVEQADTFRNNGDLLSLVNLAQRVIQAQPQNWLAWYVLGDAYNDQRNDTEAEKCLWQSLRLRETEGPYEVLGFLYLRHQQMEDALHCFAKAGELDPASDRYQYERAETFREMGRTQEAIDTVEMAYWKEGGQRTPFARKVYFDCLRDHIYHSISYNRSSGRHLILNRRQLDFVKDRLPRLAELEDPENPAQVRAERELRQIVLDAEKTSGFFNKHGYEKNYETASDEVRRTGLQ